MDLDTLLRDATNKMAKSFDTLKDQFSGLRTGKASPALVENVSVIYYGQPTRLRDMAAIRVADARLLTVTPYDASALADIEKGILAANVGVTPINDGRLIRVPIPELDEERRKEIVKVARRHAEDARVAVRNVRRDANDTVKAMQKNGDISEDQRDAALADIQKKTDATTAKIDAELKAKEAEVMAV